MDSIVLQFAAIAVVALAAQWLAWRINVPSIVFLLAGGITLGPVTGLIDPGELFGDLLFPFVSFSVAIILFEGSLTLKFHEIRDHGAAVRRMISVGALITWVVVSAAAHTFAGFSWPLAILFGSVMIVTGPTVIVPMLRSVRPTKGVANVLKWEGILIDPIGAILALVTFDVIIASSLGAAMGDVSLLLARIAVVGVVIGGLAAFALGTALRRDWLPGYLHNPTVLLTVVAAFAVSDGLQHEAGLLSVTIMGIALANMKDVDVHDIVDFKESLSILLISALFIVLAARLDFAVFAALGWATVIVFAVAQLVARPINAMVSTIGSDFSWRERALLSWIAPRGIVAAAIASVFALRLEEAGIAGAELLVPLAFGIIIGTVMLQSLTAPLLARLLGVSQPATGVLVCGANSVGRALADALQEAGFTVLVTDLVWSKISAARVAGLPVYYGNPASDHADLHMELGGIGTMIAVSRDRHYNALVCSHFRHEFGRDAVYAVRSGEDDGQGSRFSHARHRATPLFQANCSYDHLAALLRRGTIRAVTLTEEFDWAAFREQADPDMVALCAWPENQERLTVFSTDELPETVDSGWTLLYLAPVGEAAVPAVADTAASATPGD